MESHYKWAAIVFALGIILMIADVIMARKKKEGFTSGDRGRITGMFWITCAMSALVGFLVWSV